MEKLKSRTPNYVGVGVCLGLVFGVAMDSIPIGLCLGIAIGAALQRQHQEDGA
jgi:hypothetical protein